MEKQIQNYDNTPVANQTSGFNKSKFIWIIILIIIFTGLITTFYFIFTNDTGKLIERGKEPQKTTQDIAKLEKCLEMREFDLNCNLLFSNPDIEEKCEKLTKLKDECFYKIAIMNFNQEYCEKITDENLKQDCEMDSFVGDEEFHE
ncbi:hypothetical protein KAT36_04390 [Candidatus Pacearchaeota archaeon]|nr:hypothetical protein [Candidatus Pacearchaeota archaeon]